MAVKTRLDKLSKTAKSLPAQPEQPEVEEIRVYDDDGVHIYRTDAEARTAHPWLSDPAVCLTVIAPENRTFEDRTGQ